MLLFGKLLVLFVCLLLFCVLEDLRSYQDSVPSLLKIDPGGLPGALWVRLTHLFSQLEELHQALEGSCHDSAASGQALHVTKQTFSPD